MYRIQVYESLENHKLEEGWRDIYSINTYCLQSSYEWARIWWKHFQKKSSRLFIVTAEENGRIVGIGPFVIEKNILLRQLRFIGSGLTDYQAILAAPGAEEEITSSILDYALRGKEYGVINLEQIPGDSPLFAVCDRNPFLRKREMIRCPRIIFDSLTWDQYFSGLSRNLRRDWTKKYNRLKREGKLEFRRLNSPDEKGRFMREIFELHIKRWEGQRRQSKLRRPSIRGFISEAALTIPECLIYVLLYNGKIVSYRLGFAQSGVFYDWNTSYDPEYHSRSVGIILLGLAIRDTVDHHYQEFNFMRGDEDYKRKWMTTGRTVTNYQFLAGAPTLSGYLTGKYYLEWKWSAKQVFRRVLETPAVQKILIRMQY
jgi:CelD/BcsL family acetyltransferase involved in cellulose biosynthesis